MPWIPCTLWVSWTGSMRAKNLSKWPLIFQTQCERFSLIFQLNITQGSLYCRKSTFPFLKRQSDTLAGFWLAMHLQKMRWYCGAFSVFVSYVTLRLDLQLFKEKAVHVANLLLPAFDTPTGIPYSLINVNTWVLAVVLMNFVKMHFSQEISKELFLGLGWFIHFVWVWNSTFGIWIFVCRN